MTALASTEARVKAAIDLLAASPPHRTRGMQRDIVAIHSAETGEFDTAFVETLLSAADQLVTPVQCKNCGEKYAKDRHKAQALGDPFTRAKCAGWYLPSEYNRDGDHYRCPWCNTYPTAASKKRANGGTFFPSDACRELELIANLVFAEYTQLYYGNGSVCSCYCWDVEGGEIDMAILIAQRLASGNGDEDGAEGSSGGKKKAADTLSQGPTNVWTTTHVIAINPSASQPGEWDYTMFSTLYLDLSLKSSTEPVLNDDGSTSPPPAKSQARCSGFVSHASKTFSTKPRGAKAKKPHVAIIGQHIQKLENRLRDMVGEIYFGKMALAVSGFREKVKRHRMLLPETETAEAQAAPATNAARSQEREAAASPQSPDSYATASPVADTGEVQPDWEEVLDEEGNMYYYNVVTEETSWERPPEDVPVKPLKKKKKKDKKKEQEEEVAAPPVVEAAEPTVVPEAEVEAPEQTVEELLDALGLTGGTPYDYARALRKQLKVKTIWDLVYLESPDESLASIIEAYGDRRKVLKWIRKNQPAE